MLKFLWFANQSVGMTDAAAPESMMKGSGKAPKYWICNILKEECNVGNFYIYIKHSIHDVNYNFHANLRE